MVNRCKSPGGGGPGWLSNVIYLLMGIYKDLYTHFEEVRMIRWSGSNGSGGLRDAGRGDLDMAYGMYMGYLYMAGDGI